MERRDNILTIATGMQEIGKTNTTLKDILSLVYSETYPRKALIFDVNGNEYAEKEIVEDNGTRTKHLIQTLPHDQIYNYANFKGSDIRRIAPFNSNGSAMSFDDIEKLLLRALTEFRNGIFLLEDLNKVFAEGLPLELSGKITSLRHSNVDLILHLQSLGRILPKMYQNVKLIRMHAQLDSVERSRSKLAGEEEVYIICEKMINKEYDKGNKYLYVYIRREMRKVTGAFSNKMFADAVMEYLSENKKLLNPLLNKLDSAGNKLYNYNEALMLQTKNLVYKYNGNIKKTTM